MADYIGLRSVANVYVLAEAMSRKDCMTMGHMTRSVSAALALVFVCMGLAAAGDQIVQVGRVEMLVADNGTLRQISVDGRNVVSQLFLSAACADPSIKGDKRLWQYTHDVAKPGVRISEDAQRRAIVVSREGMLAYGSEEADRALAYQQRVELSTDGLLKCHYGVEIVRDLDWGPRPVSVAIQIPIELAAGRLCTLNHLAPRLVPWTWGKTEEVVGNFSLFQLDSPGGRTLDVVPGEAETGSLSDARAWGSFQHLYLSVSKGTPWFKGAKPIARGEKWEIDLTVQLPVGAAPSAGAQPGRVLLADDFSRAAPGDAWLPGKMPKSALDHYNKIEVAGSERALACIQDAALDLRHADKPGSSSIRSAAHGLPCRCVIEYDFTLKADDSIGSTRHSMYLRSHADPGTCLCLHVDTAKQWWFFEFKDHGKWVGEKLFYYPFRYTFPRKDAAFRVRIESYGNGTMAAWLSGDGIPATAMPVAVNSVRSWTPFQDGEMFLVSAHRGEGTVCHSQWDNVRVGALDPWPTVNELYYRGQILVEFEHYRFVPDGSWVKVEVRRKREQAALATGEVKPLVPEQSKLLLDVSKLPQATYEVVAALFDPAGQRVGESSVEFVKVRDPKLKLEDMKVYIDADNNTVVDGKPFFPIGMYCVTLGGAKRWSAPIELFAELKASGFNTVQCYSLGAWQLTPDKFDSFVMPWLDAAAEHGLKVYFDVEGPESHVRRRRGAIRDIADPLVGEYDAPPEVAWRVRKVMGHPALLCWYTADEPIGHGRAIEDLARQNRLIKLLDPHHPTVIATCPGGEHCGGYRKCCQGVDILATDHYPMFRKEPAHAWRRTALLGEHAVQGLQALWAIPQCYARGYGREMTEAEIRLETYLAIVHGARGVVWWACYYCKHDHPACWAATKRLAGELGRLSPILLDKTAKESVKLDPADAPIDTLLKQHAGKRYLIAVNHSPEPVSKVAFKLPKVEVCKSYLDGRALGVERGTSFSDAFPAYRVRIYELR